MHGTHDYFATRYLLRYLLLTSLLSYSLHRMNCSDFDIPVEVVNYFDMEIGTEGGIPFFDGNGMSENALRKVMHVCMD